MNGMIVPSVSAGSSHRAARETCTPQVMTPSGAAWSGRAHASRRNAIATGARRARPPLGWRAGATWLAKAVQALFLLGDSLEVPFDDLARMRPGRHGVGVVGRPHDVLDPDELAARHSHPIQLGHDPPPRKSGSAVARGVFPGRYLLRALGARGGGARLRAPE